MELQHVISRLLEFPRFGRHPPDIIGGFSQGAIVAWRLVIEELFRPHRVFLLCPREFDCFPKDLAKAATIGVETRLVSGNTDPFVSFHRGLHSDLHEAGVRAPLDVVDGLGHWFPEDLASRLAALAGQ